MVAKSFDDNNVTRIVSRSAPKIEEVSVEISRTWIPECILKVINLLNDEITPLSTFKTK